MDFAYQNGMSALALTDHGNMNGMSYQVLHTKKMRAAGKEFKPIFGVEAYFVPSIKEWKEEYEAVKEDKKKARKVISDTDKVSAEDEGASKRKSKNKINSRRHIVLVAINQTGLNNIFKIVSDSHQGDNFYRYPRLDYDMLKKYGEGVVASSACLGGVYAGDYWDNCVYEEYVNENQDDRYPGRQMVWGTTVEQCSRTAQTESVCN
jgi:DNA polymerase-3 subunit alpha